MIIRQTDGLSTQIYNDLKKKIEEFEYLPGDRLSESILAEKYQVSRTPIKHSLSRLENDGIIHVKPQIGTFVSKIDTEHVHEFFEIRMLLEVAIISDVKFKIDDKFKKLLTLNIEAQKKLCEDDVEFDSVKISKLFWKLDNSFHKIIFDSINKGFIWDYILEQSSQFNRFRVLSASINQEDLNEKVSDHIEIYNYIMFNDEADIKQIYFNHLFASLEDTIKKLEQKYPDYF